MRIRKGYKYTLKANTKTRQHFARYAGACRFVWNKVLALNEGRYLAGVPRLPYPDASRLLTLWKHSEEYGWLKDVNAQALQQCLVDLERAYANCFAGRSAPPRFRKKLLADAFRFPQGFRVQGNTVFLPKIGSVRFWRSRPIEGTIKNVTVSRQAEKWCVAFQVEVDVPDPVHPATAAVGIDLGIATFAATSDGALHAPLNAYRQSEKQRARLQQRLARKVKYSQNWKKQQRRIARLESRIANQRQDFLHKLSTDISKNHAVVVLEDLRVRNMSRSARGTVDEPGKNVAAKAGLNKAILDQGWRTFRSMLEYKQLWRGGEVIAVNPRYTSQTCPECGHVSAKNRAQQALFSCEQCRYSYHADTVAARNILARGQRREVKRLLAS